MEKNDLPLSSSDKGSAPPSYNQEAVDITSGFAKLDLNSRPSKPSVDQCIAHLKLLEAFHQLREDIATSDGLFGISDNEATGSSKREEVLAKLREKRWAVYVARAADRFERWWTTAIPNSQEPLRQRDVASKGQFDRIVSVGKPMNITHLPPLDVLMVWHSYMLNPRCFLEDCIRFGKMDFWVTGLPWNMINACIDNSTFDYTTSNEAMRAFEGITSLAWDNLHNGPEKTINCPNCQKKIDGMWTSHESFSKTSGEIILYGVGYADRDFSIACLPCGLVIDHDLLRVQKFRRDVQLLLKDDRPMPGTILSVEGLPQKASSHGRHGPFFPNRLISASLKTGLLDVSDARRGPLAAIAETGKGSLETIQEIRDTIELAIRTGSLVRKANDTVMSTRLLRIEKIAIRRMLAQYWDNSSVFGLDLVGAVIRQGSFIGKMHSIDWIHSPALSATMQRLIGKYDRYFTILAKHPDHVAVPTLDIDLAWHTHQLSPPQYYDFSVQTTKVFIDHDDKIDENKLSDAFEWTSKTYQKMFDEVYSECTCWYCEAIRESHHSGLGRLFFGEPTSLERLHASTEKCDPNKTPHISAHNAVKAKSLAVDKIAAIKAAQLETSYHKACRRAQKKGRTPPARDDYTHTYATGYPLYMVYSAPYKGDPCITDGMYAGNPACMNVSLGAPGNCAAGTCGGGVAAGACAGAAAGGCAGGAAGGCGGGGGGGCGGGGGGGCGGGGGGGGGGCGGGGGGGC